MHYSTMFQQLANDTRMRIVALLSQGELCVCGLEEILEIRQVNISKHLNKLKQANIVASRREKQRIFYYLTDSFLEQTLLIRYLEDVILDDPTMQEDHERFLKHKSSDNDNIYVCNAFKKENLS
ncbi:MAG: ArsR/SmtB family transcription factor [Bacillota bacterium]